jgi:hypothetical protein
VDAPTVDADGDETDDEDEVYFGPLSVKESSKRVNAIKEQATLVPPTLHDAALPADLAGKLAACSSAAHVNRQQQSAATFRETLESAIRSVGGEAAPLPSATPATAAEAQTSRTTMYPLIDLGPLIDLRPSDTADDGAKRAPEEEEEEVFFGKLSTHEVKKTVAQMRKEQGHDEAPDLNPPPPAAVTSPSPQTPSKPSTPRMAP